MTAHAVTGSLFSLWEQTKPDKRMTKIEDNLTEQEVRRVMQLKGFLFLPVRKWIFGGYFRSRSGSCVYVDIAGAITPPPTN